MSLAAYMRMPVHSGGHHGCIYILLSLMFLLPCLAKDDSASVPIPLLTETGRAMRYHPDAINEHNYSGVWLLDGISDLRPILGPTENSLACTFSSEDGDGSCDSTQTGPIEVFSLKRRCVDDEGTWKYFQQYLTNWKGKQREPVNWSPRRAGQQCGVEVWDNALPSGKLKLLRRPANVNYSIPSGESFFDALETEDEGGAFWLRHSPSGNCVSIAEKKAEREQWKVSLSACGERGDLFEEMYASEDSDLSIVILRHVSSGLCLHSASASLCHQSSG